MSILDNIAYIPCHPENCGVNRAAERILYLVYHYTGNDGDHDTNNALYYRDNVVRASAHYFVDDDSVTQSVPDLRVAWAVGGTKWTDCAKTGGGKLYGVVTNSNSLSIELCDTDRDGALMATEATLARSVALGRALMDKYHIPIERVVRHFDVTGKHCPAYFMDEQKWEAFKRRLTEEDNMTQEQFEVLYEKVNPLYTTLEQVPGYWREETAALMKAGALRGDGGNALHIRHEALGALVAAARLKGGAV